MATAFLKIVAGPRQGMNVPLSATTPLTIGRKRGELLIDDPMVSGLHAQVVPREGGWVLQDLGSTNGTLLDGRLVREEALRPGAEIGIGATRLVLFVGLPEAEADEAGNRYAGQVELAWLLDEELVDGGGEGQRTIDTIDQNLRLPPGLNAVVEAVAGVDTGRTFRFTRGNVTIGRKVGEIPLSDLEVSRRHATIEVFGRDMIYVRDLGSTNGTYHNGRRITVARLKTGDTVGIGKTVLKLVVNR